MGSSIPCYFRAQAANVCKCRHARHLSTRLLILYPVSGAAPTTGRADKNARPRH